MEITLGAHFALIWRLAGTPIDGSFLATVEMLVAISSGAAGYTLPHAAHTSPRCTPLMGEAPKIWTPDDISWTPKVFGDTNDRDLVYGPMTGKYCEDLSKVIRRKTRTVTAGPVKFGSEHPLVRQTMATTLTSDVEGTIEQVIRCADEGFDLVSLQHHRQEAVLEAVVIEDVGEAGADHTADAKVE